MKKKKKKTKKGDTYLLFVLIPKPERVADFHFANQPAT